MSLLIIVVPTTEEIKGENINIRERKQYSKECRQCLRMCSLVVVAAAAVVAVAAAVAVV